GIYADGLMMQEVAVSDMSFAPKGVSVRNAYATGAMNKAPVPAAAKSIAMEEDEVQEEEVSTPPVQEITIRKNLQETAFFFPQLRTDEKGNIRIQFTMPEAVTEWKMMAFAHTKDMAYGMLDGKIKTQKDLMVIPNLPRFLRQGDEIMLSSKISNLSDQQLKGVATLHILDAQTMRPLDLPFP